MHAGWRRRDDRCARSDERRRIARGLRVGRIRLDCRLLSTARSSASCETSSLACCVTSFPACPGKRCTSRTLRDPGSLKQLQRLQVHDQRLGEYLISGPFARLAEILLGEPPDPQNLQYFNKAPGVNRATPAHQDGAYFPIEPMNAVTIWLALEDIGPAQGCLRYLRGSHRDGLRPHRRSCTLGFSRELIGDASKNVEREVAFPCAAGHVMGAPRADGAPGGRQHLDRPSPPGTRIHLLRRFLRARRRRLHRVPGSPRGGSPEGGTTSECSTNWSTTPCVTERIASEWRSHERRLESRARLGRLANTRRDAR